MADPIEPEPGRDILSYGSPASEAHDVVMVSTPEGPKAYHRPSNAAYWIPFSSMQPKRDKPGEAYFHQTERDKDFDQRNALLRNQIMNLDLPHGRNVNKETINAFIDTPEAREANKLFERELFRKSPDSSITPFKRMIQITGTHAYDFYSTMVPANVASDAPASPPPHSPPAEKKYVPMNPPRKIITGNRIAAAAGLALVGSFIYHETNKPDHFIAPKPDNLLTVDPHEFAKRKLDPSSKQIFEIFIKRPTKDPKQTAEYYMFDSFVAGEKARLEEQKDGKFKLIYNGKPASSLFPKENIKIVRVTDKEGKIEKDAKANIEYAYSQLHYPDEPKLATDKAVSQALSEVEQRKAAAISKASQRKTLNNRSEQLRKRLSSKQNKADTGRSRRHR